MVPTALWKLARAFVHLACGAIVLGFVSPTRTAAAALPGLSSRPGTASTTCGLLQGAIGSLDEVFDFIDLDKNGSLDAKETSAVISRREDRPLDLNADGKTSRGEFRESFLRVRRTQVNTLFDTMDRRLLEIEERACSESPADTVVNLSAVIGLQSEYSPAQVALGIALRRAGRAAEAKVTLKRAIQLGPANSAAWLELAATDDVLGQQAECSKDLEEGIRFLRIESSFKASTANARESLLEKRVLSVACHFLKRGRPDLAMKLLEPAVGILGGNSVLCDVLAELRAGIGKSERKRRKPR